MRQPRDDRRDPKTMPVCGIRSVFPSLPKRPFLYSLAAFLPLPTSLNCNRDAHGTVFFRGSCSLGHFHHQGEDARRLLPRSRSTWPNEVECAMTPFLLDGDVSRRNDSPLLRDAKELQAGLAEIVALKEHSLIFSRRSRHVSADTCPSSAKPAWENRRCRQHSLE